MLASINKEGVTRGRHPVRNYLVFAILTILCIVGVSLVLETPAAGESGVAPLADDSVPASCRLDGPMVSLPEITEASGIAASRRTPGLLWTHIDSGKPVLFALDKSGGVKGRVQVAGVALEDWEDLAIGPCGSESCLYLADIGDNDARRPHISVYRVPEPMPGDAATRRAEAFHATYPDGPHDAEALVVSKDGRVLIVTKGNSGPSTVYRFPEPLHAGVSVRLEKLGALSASKNNKDERVTGASTSPDGSRIALRTHDSVLFYDAQEFLHGRFSRPLRFDVTALAEAQGEGIALGPDDAVALVGEGGGKKRPGSLARAVCTLGPANH